MSLYIVTISCEVDADSIHEAFSKADFLSRVLTNSDACYDASVSNVEEME